MQGRHSVSPTSPSSPSSPRPLLDPALRSALARLSDDDLELLEICGAQIAENTAKMTKLVREIFDVLEQALQPDKFAHKARMVGHVLFTQKNFMKKKI